MKRLFFALLFSILITVCCMIAAACDTATEKETKDFSEIVFESVTVDVGDKPDYFAEIYSFGVQKVIVDGEELGENKYLVKNGYFAFAYENYKLMGLGTHSVKVVFAEGEKEFSITVTDVKAADFSLTFALPNGCEVGEYSLPKAEKNNAFQEYSLSYLLKFGEEVLDMRDDGDSFYYAFEKTGNYDFCVEVIKNGTMTEHKFNFSINDVYAFSEETDYADKDAYRAFNGDYDDKKGCIVNRSGGYLTIDGGLVARAKYSGYQYLSVIVGADYDNDCYTSFKYVYGNVDMSVGTKDGEFYSHSGTQTILLDFTNITKQSDKHSLFYSSKPINLYSAKFVKTPLTDEINYACHAYRKSELWAQSNNGGWDYTGDDIMELHTDRTICFSTEKLKQALELGYTKVVLSAKNTSSDAKLYYNAKATDFEGNYPSGNSDSSLAFAGNVINVAIDITGIAESDNKWTYLAGVTDGKMVVTSLTFTNLDVAEVKISYDGEFILSKELIYGKETLDMTKFGFTSSIDGLAAVWTLDDKSVDMSDENMSFDEGAHSLVLTLKGQAIGRAAFSITVYKELSFDEFNGELVDDKYVDYWKANSEFRVTADGFSGGGSLMLKTVVIMAAKKAGYNYLEVVAYPVDGWISSPLNGGEFSTFDGATCFTVDLSNVTPNAGFTQIVKVNQFAVMLKSAKFTQYRITENVDYAHLYYRSSGIWAATDGLGWVSAYPKYTELNEMGYPCATETASNSWKAFFGTQGTPCLSKAFLEEANTAGFTEITLTYIGLKGADKLYYYDQVSSPEVTFGLNVNALPDNVKTVDFVDGRASVTLSITNVSDLQGSWAYLAGVMQGTALIEHAVFGK